MSYKIEHVNTQIPERNDYVLYLIYDNVKINAIPVPADKTATEALRDAMIVNFDSFKLKYANKVLTHGNLRFEEIDYGAQKNAAAGTLNDSFVTPSFRFVMPNGYMFTSTSNGTNLQQFFDESLNEYLNNTFWPYFVYKNENNIKKLRLDYLPSATLDDKIRIYIIYDSTNTNHNSMKAIYDAMAPTLVNVADYTKETIDISSKYILYNMQDIVVPSIRVIMPDRVIRMFDNPLNDFNAFLDTIYANYNNSFSSVLPALITPITKTKVFLFVNSNGTAPIGLDSVNKTLCRQKVSADLQASFYKFKDYYQNLIVLPSKEIEFIHVELNPQSCFSYDSGVCTLPLDLDGNDTTWPRIAIYLPDGRKTIYDPTIPDYNGTTVLCPHKSYYWDIHNLVTKTLKKYISKVDLINSLTQNDAAIVFIGNSVRDRDVFDSIIEYNSIYLPFYYCVTADCLSEFKVTNGDVLFINSKKSAYVAGTTDVRVLANGYTSSMLAKFIKHS